MSTGACWASSESARAELIVRAVELEGATAVARGFRRAPLGEKDAEVELGVGRVGIERDRLAVLLLRGVELARDLIEVGQVVMGGLVARRKRDGALHVLDGGRHVV